MTTLIPKFDLKNGVSTPTGAINRPINEKLAEIVSVQDFGADPTGVADSTSAFNAAIAASNYVFIPSGTYLISSTINITTNITLSGPDSGSQHYQPVTINHSASSTGSLFNVTTNVSGVSLKNFQVTGGNGSFCIVSSNSYVRYEYIRMEPYNGGGIQLLATGVGSSSSKIANCQWVGPTTPTNYTGFEINVNGGDVSLYKCTAIYGAIGINIIQGQTIFVDNCSLNAQAITYAYSSATQFNTCGIKLSGTAYKQAISIRNTYIEACTNSIYVEACESLSIEDNFILSNTMSFDGTGNGLITLKDSNAKNVTIKNNYLSMLATGTAPTPYYGLYFNNAVNVIYINNNYTYGGDYSGQFYLTSSTTCYSLANTLTYSGTNPVASYDPSNLMNIFVANPTPVPTTPATFLNSWVDFGSTAPCKYYKDQLGIVHLEGTITSGAIGSAAFVLPSGFRPKLVSSFPSVSNNAYGTCYIDTSGNVVPLTGSNASFHLDGITFRTV